MKLPEFLALTPRQFEALRGRRDAERTEAGALLELMMAQQAALTFNTRMTFAKEPAKITEFMPSKWKDADARPVKPRVRRKGKSGLPIVCEGFATLMKMMGAKEKVETADTTLAL